MSTEGVAGSPTAPVTVPEFCVHVEDAFVADRTGVPDLLNAAPAGRARPAVFAALNRLPDRRFESLMDLLSELPDLSFDCDAQ
ncbi:MULTISPECIES: hypothetical protein [Amycolatopsis]|uniref:hypothetical protein n=1 Tax=Amycolatopsis TaxID=1813 RepID=UPI000E27C024|nr:MULTISPECIES: hypothetical protein [Amycolatopsis]